MYNQKPIIVDNKKLIAEKFNIKESSIEYTAGNKDINTFDSYSFYPNKAIGFNVIDSLIRAMPNLVLKHCVILETKVILRCN